MESLIPVINKLQDIFSVTGAHGGNNIIKLPQIVAVGGQSSGKSSVLESLVGRAFLPRGTGIVTRCPIILQLMNSESEIQEHAEGLEVARKGEDWCVFLHNESKVYTDFDKVREEIEQQTVRLAGKSRGISQEPIGLKIFSKTAIQLTVVDLPGLVKTKLRAEDPDIEEQVKDLILSYIDNENCIILAISEANIDLARSESLDIAKQVDPAGRRTLHVITKLDLMDEGTNAVDILCGRVIDAQLGIVGVRNRSQQDIIDNKSIAAGIKSEAVFLQKRYPLLAATNGIPYLAKRLNSILMDHIAEYLPSLESQIRTMLTESQTTLKSLKDTDEDKEKILYDMFFKFNIAYCGAIVGRSRNIDSSKLCGGALINVAFHETLGLDLQKVHPIQNISDEEILIAIRNSGGVESNLSIPEDALHDLVKRHIHSLKRPSLNCAIAVDSALKQIIDDCFALPEISPYMVRFPVMKATFSAMVRDKIGERLAYAEELLANYIDDQASFVFTKQKSYIDQLNSLKSINLMEPRLSAQQIMTNRRNYVAPSENSLELDSKEEFQQLDDPYLDSGRLTTTETAVNGTRGVLVLNPAQKSQCATVRSLMISYFEVVKSAVHDYVPKALTRSMMYYMVDNLQTDLIGKWHDYNDDRLEKLMQESPHIAMQRANASHMLEVLQSASDSIAQVRETNL